MRCFLCIEIQKPEIINGIVRFQEELKLAQINKIKFVELENLHLTLKFLGEIETTLIDNLFSIMKEAPFSPFTINFETVGSFPASNPRVIWIGISKGQDQILSLISFFENKLKVLGFKPEKRIPSVHLTVGRIKYVNDRKTFLEILQKWKDHLFGSINVRSFQLKKSVLTPKGPIYTILKQIEG